MKFLLLFLLTLPLLAEEINTLSPQEKADGHIMITDHIDECSFRNMKILPGTADQ